MKVNKIKYTNANISFGYAYNWVFARNCLACISLTPAIAYKASDVDAETHEGKQWYSKFNLDFLIRAGIVYNNGKYFVGSSFVGKTIIIIGTISLWTTDSAHFKCMQASTSICAKNIGRINKNTYIRNLQLACLSKESLYICPVLTFKTRTK